MPLPLHAHSCCQPQTTFWSLSFCNHPSIDHTKGSRTTFWALRAPLPLASPAQLPTSLFSHLNRWGCAPPQTFSDWLQPSNGLLKPPTTTFWAQIAFKSPVAPAQIPTLLHFPTKTAFIPSKFFSLLTCINKTAYSL